MTCRNVTLNICFTTTRRLHAHCTPPPSRHLRRLHADLTPSVRRPRRPASRVPPRVSSRPAPPPRPVHAPTSMRGLVLDVPHRRRLEHPVHAPTSVHGLTFDAARRPPRAPLLSVLDALPEPLCARS